MPVPSTNYPTTGLAAYYNSAEGLTSSADRVSAMTDGTANGYTLSQATSGNQPLRYGDYLAFQRSRTDMLNRTTTPSLNKQDFTVLWAGMVTTRISGQMLWASAAGDLAVWIQGGTLNGLVVSIYDGGVKTTTFPNIDGFHTIVVRSNGSGCTVRVNGVTQTVSTLTAGTGTGFCVGHWTGGGLAHDGLFRCAQVWTRALTLGEMSQAEDHAWSLVSIDLPKAVVMCQGDSITEGQSSTVNWKKWVTQAAIAVPDAIFLNHGTSGDALVQMLAEKDAVNGWLEQWPRSMRRIFVLFGGTNDLTASTAATTYTRWQSVYDAHIGWFDDFVVIPTLSRNAVDYVTKTKAYNDSVAADSRQKTIVTLPSALASSTFHTDTTVCTDGVHPIDNGHALLGAAVAAHIRTLIDATTDSVALRLERSGSELYLARVAAQQAAASVQS